MIAGIITEQYLEDLLIEKIIDFSYPYNRHRQGVCALV